MSARFTARALRGASPFGCRAVGACIPTAITALTPLFARDAWRAGSIFRPFAIDMSGALRLELRDPLLNHDQRRVETHIESLQLQLERWVRRRNNPTRDAD